MTTTRRKKASTILSNTVLALLVAVALLLAFYLAQSRITGSEPSLAGYRICIIMSGSMEPAVKTGSMALVRPLAAEKVVPGDIITFRSAGSDRLITHRVDHLDTETSLLFYTRGDANNAVDSLPVTRQQLVGKVVFTAPYLGYLLACARSREGLLLLFLLAALIVGGGAMRTCALGKKQHKQNTGGEVAAE